MRDERFHVELVLRKQIENGLKIPPFCPAHETQRVVVAALFVGRIVTTRTVRAGNLKTDFLFIKVRARELKAAYPDQDNAPALTAHLRRLLYRLVALRVLG